MFRFAALFAFAAAAFAKTPCETLPIDDAVVILSQNAQQHDLGVKECDYEVATPYLKLQAVSLTSGKQAFEQMKRMSVQGATVKDEPEVGLPAFSVVSRTSEAIYILKGETTFGLVLSNPGSSTPLPDLMIKIRSIAKRVAARL